MPLNPSPRVTSVRLVQFKNVVLLQIVSVLNIVTLVSLRHELNAYPPILLTLSGIVTLVRLSQVLNELWIYTKKVDKCGIMGSKKK